MRSAGLFVDTEGNRAVVDIVGQCIGHHGNHHDDILACLLHGEEWDDIVRKVLPAKSLKENPADAELQSEANEETTHEQQQFPLEVVLGFEDPVAIPQETVDNTKDVADDIRDTVRKPHLGIEKIEHHKRDECVQHTYHSILEQLYSRLAGFGFIYLHDNSYIPSKLEIFNEVTKK